jgi:hypothetical protein
VALPLQPWLLWIRATLLGNSLAQAIPDRPIGTFNALGMSYSVGTCSLIAWALALAAMLSISIFLQGAPVGARRRYLRILSGIGSVLLLALELATVGGLPERATALLLATVLVVFDTLCGVLVIESFAFPLLMTMGDPRCDQTLARALEAKKTIRSSQEDSRSGDGKADKSHPISARVA